MHSKNMNIINGFRQLYLVPEHNVKLAREIKTNLWSSLPGRLRLGQVLEGLHPFGIDEYALVLYTQGSAFSHILTLMHFRDSVCRSSSLDWKKDQNRTEPNCKRLDHWPQLHKFWKFSVASCEVCQKIKKLKKTGLDWLQPVFHPVMCWTLLTHIFT